jgi:DNA-binding SARP family transcriptional activator/streptogramin lyase
MEFRILGPLQVLADDRQIVLGAAQQREVLAILLLHRGEVVSVDRIVDELWGERPPNRATKTVQVYVSRLRKALGDGVLVTRGGGYALELNGASVDADRFSRLADAGRKALDNGDPEAASETLTAALDLWRGPPLADFAYEPFAQKEAARLEELRLVTLEDRAEADLALGQHVELAPELEALVREHPTRERLLEGLMLALYRSGRQVEALDAYRDARRMLDEKLGLEPGSRLQELEQSILTHDPAIAAPPGRGAAAVLRRHRRGGMFIALGGALLLAVAVAAVALKTGSGETPTPPRVLPNSLVRIDPDTLEATDVVPVGSAPDLVVAAGGFVWITHHILRDFGSDRVRDAGDRTLKRVNPDTGQVETVGGGLAPCGLAPDPSGDVWVANCFASRGSDPNVVRVDAKTLDFEATYRVPEGDVRAGDAYYRGLAYGGGSLWVGGLGERGKHATVIKLDPHSGEQRATGSEATALAWAETSGDLWASNFNEGTLTRLDASTRAVEKVNVLGPFAAAAHILVDGETVWVGDWDHPRVERLRAVGPRRRRLVELPVRNVTAGVWNIAAGEGYIWATTPQDRALWRIDPKTNESKRIPMPYPPTGVTANEGDVWVTVRKTTSFEDLRFP